MWVSSPVLNYHTMETYSSARVKIHPLLNSALNRSVIIYMIQLLYHQENTPGTYWIGWWMGPQSQSRYGTEIKTFPLTKNRTLVIAVAND